MSQFSHYRVTNEQQIAELNPAGGHEPAGNFISRLVEKLKIEITRLTDTDIEFDLVGVDASIANALRRILLAEVSTVAIEHVWIAVNSSIIQDEVLAHRVGLIPIKADPSKLEYVVGEEETDKDTIVFHFDVECKSVVNSAGEVTTENEKALSGSLNWLPQGNQNEVFPEGVAPVHNDIVVAQLKPGQRIEFEAHCRKGLGKDHTKFSPVATAAYRLLPDISIKEPVTGAKADELVEMCPMNVFDIEDLGGVRTAHPARARDCTMCRECIRRPGWEDNHVQLRRKADHFLFSVESVGSMAPSSIVREAISVLKSKAVKFQGIIENECDLQL